MNLTSLMGNRLPNGSVLQTLFYTNSANTVLTNVVPWDTTIPQITEGTQIFSQSITPSSISNKIRIRCIFAIVRQPSSGNLIAGSIFRNSTSDAIFSAAGNGQSSTSNREPDQLIMEWIDSPATTSATTYSIRIGPDQATFYLNGESTGVMIGMIATLSLEEIKA